MNRRSNFNNDPRIIQAKFACKCKETGVDIKVGDECIYYPNGKAIYSMASKQATQFNAWRQDLAMGYDY